MSIAEPRRAIANEEVHIWRAVFGAGSLAQEEELDEQERRRATQFHFAKDRIFYIQAHSMVRKVLSAYTGLAPHRIDYEFGPHGKPSLTEGSIRFNLSHSAGVAALAVTRNREIGLDVEQMRSDVEFLQIAQRFFSARECQVLARSADSIERTFYRIWTCKEAYMKARGVGLSLPSSSFDVCGDDSPGVLSSDDRDRWLLREFDPGFGCAGALVVEEGPLNLTILDYAKDLK